MLDGEEAVIAAQKAIEAEKVKKGAGAKKENGEEDLFGKLVNVLDEAESKKCEAERAEAEKQRAGKFAKARQQYEAAVAAQGGFRKASVSAVKVEKPKAEAVTAKAGGSESEKCARRRLSEQMSSEPEPNVAIADETLDLNLPESLEIIRLLALVGDYMHLDYMYDPSKVTAPSI